MKKGNILAIILIVAAVIAGYLLLKQFSAPTPQPTPQTSTDQTITDSTPYTSKDLKISFNYPKDWYVDDRYQNILLTTYKTSLNEDLKPNDSQLEILISNFSGCHKTIEENLKDPACGEGGPNIKNNIITSKESRTTLGGTLYKYVIETPKGKSLTYYLLEKGNTVLQISKQPDPSQYEKEFEEIINSIQFLE